MVTKHGKPAVVVVDVAEYERLRQLNQDGKNASDKALEAARAAFENDAALVTNAEQSQVILNNSSRLRWVLAAIGAIQEMPRDEVLRLLRASRNRIADAVRAIPDNQLDIQRETPVGPMSAAQRVEKVLIGHMKQHQGSIEAAIK